MNAIKYLMGVQAHQGYLQVPIWHQRINRAFRFWSGFDNNNRPFSEQLFVRLKRQGEVLTVDIPIVCLSAAELCAIARANGAKGILTVIDK